MREMGGRRWRISAACAATTVAIAVTSVVLGAPGARAVGGGPDAALAHDTNSARAAAGLPGFAYASDLASVAQGQAQRMAADLHIFHNPNLGSEVEGWQMAGENVGVGADAQAVHDAFMASPRHRDNILSSSFTEFGIGTTVGSDGRLYVAEVFRLPEAAPEAAPAPAQEPAPEPTSDPAVAPDAAPIPDPTPVNDDAGPVSDPRPASEPVTPDTVPATRPAPSPTIVSTPAPTRTATLTATPIRRSSLPIAAVRPRLVSSVSPAAVVRHGTPIMWLAALLAQAVLIAHMVVFWRRSTVRVDL